MSCLFTGCIKKGNRTSARAYCKHWTGLWTGLWTMDFGLWTLDFGLWTFDFEIILFFRFSYNYIKI
jgi:beta-glucanase (GH16 family)